MITLLAALAIGQSPRSSALAPDGERGERPLPGRGDAARVNGIGPDGRPIPFAIYPDLEEAGRHISAAARATSEGRQYQPGDGTLMIAHNTPVRVEGLGEVRAEGTAIPMAAVRLEAGPLKGSTYWISARRLRRAGEPDPAAEPPPARSLRDLRWDPEYRPKIGDAVVLAGLDPKTRGPMAAILESELGPAPAAPLSDSNMLMAASGTRATVLQLGAAMIDLGAPKDRVHVRIESGPFAGQTGWLFDAQLSRPSVYERESGRRSDPAAGPAEAEDDARRPGRAEPDPPAQGPELVLLDVAANPSATGNFIEIAGRLRNASRRPIRFVKVTVSFEDRRGRLVRSETGLCDPQVVGPGELGSFELSARNDPRYDGYKLSFRTPEAAIKWVDKSGKNVHD